VARPALNGVYGGRFFKPSQFARVFEGLSARIFFNPNGKYPDFHLPSSAPSATLREKNQGTKPRVLLGADEHAEKIKMLTTTEAKSRLLSILREKSVFHGDFTLASGAKSTYYIDCRLTTLDPEGAWLVGQVMHSLIQTEAATRSLKIDAVGGLTMGADPIALSIGMYSFYSKAPQLVRSFVVRKAPKAHGQTKLIEGNFKPGDTVVVLDDVITRGDSTINAINAVTNEGGKVAFVAVLVDRQQGGREKIESMGYKVLSAFRRDHLLDSQG
jgi:orotate phosphoribosyltransferase